MNEEQMKIEQLKTQKEMELNDKNKELHMMLS